MSFGEKDNKIEQWLVLQSKEIKKSSALKPGIAQDALTWVAGGKKGYDGELYTKWPKI